MPEIINIKEIEHIIGYKFKNGQLLKTALTHSSYANIHGIKSNERLEFLGDTLLSTIISERIYFEMDYAEGDLSKLRSRVVSMEPLANLAESLTLDKHLMYVGSLTNNMKADMMEAIIASIYIDGGMENTKKFVSKVFGETVNTMEKLSVLADSKSYLQEHLSSAEIKKDEQGILELSDKLNIPVNFVDLDKLKLFESNDIQKSEFVRSKFGIYGVCEPSALITAGFDSKLVYKKTSYDGVTIAIAISK